MSNHLFELVRIYRQQQEDYLNQIKELNKNLKTYVNQINDQLTIMEAEDIVNGGSK